MHFTLHSLLRTASAVLLLAFIAGCSDQGSNPVGIPITPPATTSSNVSFSQDVLPILNRFGCTSCHGGSGGLFIGTVAQIKTGGTHGPAVTPGDGANSIIVKKISPTPPFGDRMPQGGPYLPDSLQTLIRRWIDQGALDN